MIQYLGQKNLNSHDSYICMIIILGCPTSMLISARLMYEFANLRTFFKCKETRQQFSHSYLRNGLHNFLQIWYGSILACDFQLWTFYDTDNAGYLDKRGFQFKLHTQICKFLNQFSLKDYFLQVKWQAENIIKKSLRW